MRRSIVRMLIASAGLMVAAPGVVHAQAALSVQLYWEWGDDGWRPYRPVVQAPVREVVHYAPRPRVHVPPGHMPPPGMCRLWYPGRPPGHQPKPERCDRLFRRHHGPGVVIVGAPAHLGGKHDRGPGHGRGRGR